MTSSPLLLLLVFAGGLYFTKMWWNDFRAAAAGRPPAAGALPGAQPARPVALLVAAAGGLVIVGLETAGELALGIAQEQSTLTGLMAGYTLVAAVVEEIIFRGYLVVPERRGRIQVWGGVLAASGLFALLHPFLWQWTDGALNLTLTTKGCFSTIVVFGSSLWFYAMRFSGLNPSRSLLPCFAAHAAKNAGVIVIKFAQGYLVGLW